MDLLQLNKFGGLHDGKHIIFCKTEYLKAEFKRIKRLKNEVILISGNSDEGIDAFYTQNMPDNILIWYGQNILAYHPKLRSIPIGLENTFVNKRKGHGVAWPHAEEKIRLLTLLSENKSNRLATRLLYANFNEQTNRSHRVPIKELCIKSPFITWNEPLLNYDEFINAVLDHEAVICPVGNGLDTHRLYEILYCGRVAVTVKAGNYPIYTDLYEKLPVVILDNIDDLNDEEKLTEMVNAAKQRSFNHELLDFRYWQQLISASAVQTDKKEVNLFNRLLNYIS